MLTVTELTKPMVGDGSSTIRAAMKNQISVLHALILHDIKSRYFGNGIGYIVMVVWPFAHLAFLMAIHVIAHRPTPFGTSGLLYVSTGVYPFIVWNYISRFTMLGALMNKAYLNYPVVNLLDILVSRVLLEINTSYIILIVLLLFLYFNGVSIMPIHLQQALLGVLSAAVFGIGCGVLGGVLTSIFPLFMVLWIAPIIIVYTTSGIIITPELLPKQFADLFYWNPLIHSVEMVRSAYYPDYPTNILDIKYPFIVGFCSLTLGLFAERMFSRFWK